MSSASIVGYDSTPPLLVHFYAFILHFIFYDFYKLFISGRFYPLDFFFIRCLFLFVFVHLYIHARSYLGTKMEFKQHV
jgi:hypothetical protein